MSSGSRIVVTGGRDFTNAATVDRWLRAMAALGPIALIAHGDAPGADSLAATWAKRHGIVTVPFPVTPADWKAYGKRAGPRRNGIMLDTMTPDVVLAFPGGRGTADCIRQAEARDIPVIEAYVAGESEEGAP
jgi:hypothetical protein